MRNITIFGGIEAKFTGAGGGGCMVALSYQNKTERVIVSIKNMGGGSFFGSSLTFSISPSL